MKINFLDLPEFAFLDAHNGKINELDGRTVILHIRSASVIEILDSKNAILDEDILSVKYTYMNILNERENMIAALHYCATLDTATDREMIIKEVIKPCVQWYCEYCKNEDYNILLGNE